MLLSLVWYAQNQRHIRKYQFQIPRQRLHRRPVLRLPAVLPKQLATTGPSRRLPQHLTHQLHRKGPKMCLKKPSLCLATVLQNLLSAMPSMS